MSHEFDELISIELACGEHKERQEPENGVCRWPTNTRSVKSRHGSSYSTAHWRSSESE
jgi:hypothetical protein